MRGGGGSSKEPTGRGKKVSQFQEKKKGGIRGQKGLTEKISTGRGAVPSRPREEKGPPKGSKRPEETRPGRTEILGKKKKGEKKVDSNVLGLSS